MARVELRGIEKHFGKTEVIPPALDLEIPDNALTVLVGPSGCGKSTLLRIIAGLETPCAGTVSIDGERVNDAPPSARGIAMVFQSYALYPHMTVEENMRFGLSSLKLPASEVQERIAAAAAMLDLEKYLARKPKELSGGQRQRVAMGRAVVRRPRVFLFDEPLSNLDAALRVKMRLEIARLRETLNATAVYVTHDQVEAMTLAHKLVVLRAGRIEQQGTPLDVYERPANKFVASFLGSPAMNFIPSAMGALPAGLALPRAHGVDVGIRPEHLSLDASLPLRIAGRVFAVERLGDQVLAHLTVAARDGALPPATLVARLGGDATVTPGGELSLGFDPRHCHAFAADASGSRLEA